MSIYFIAVFFVALWGVRVQWKKEFSGSFLNKETTGAINAVCVLLVFVGHIDYSLLSHIGYEWESIFWDSGYRWITAHLHQLHVVPFLFFSGFGVLEQMKRLGNGYIHDFPKRRIFALWLNFAVCVAIMAGINTVLCTGIATPRRVLASLVGMSSVGNPVWYVFCIMLCYFVTWIAMKVCAPRGGVLVVFLFLIAYHVGMIKIGKGSQWYSTVWAYFAGCCFSLYGEKLLRLCRRCYWLALSVAITMFLVFYSRIPGRFFLNNNICGIFMMGVVVLVSMKVKVGNGFLKFVGERVFPIYIYQTTFFLLARHILSVPLTPIVVHIAIILCFCLTLLVAKFYPVFSIKFDCQSMCKAGRV